MSRLVLIDGNAILHRAFHALPPLTTPGGEMINAVYGFTTMLLRLISDLQPTHIAVCFDRPAPTFRKKIFTEYQSKRPKMDDALVGQVDRVHEVVQVLGIPIFEKDGFEADDVLGTIVEKVLHRRADNQPTGHQSPNDIDQIIIVTGDKDLLQLVEDEKVLLYMPTKGLSEGKLYGEKETVERIGVPPKLVPDYKALAGDSSDNYPGIPGVGPKTALEILEKAGSIEGLYKGIEKKSFGLSDGLLKKIKEGQESALMSYQLATIKTDVPLDVEIQQFSDSQLSCPEVRTILEQLGFNSLVKRLNKQTHTGTGQSDHKNVKEKEDKTEQLTFV